MATKDSKPKTHYVGRNLRLRRYPALSRTAMKVLTAVRDGRITRKLKHNKLAWRATTEWHYFGDDGIQRMVTSTIQTLLNRRLIFRVPDTTRWFETTNAANDLLVMTGDGNEQG